MDFKTCQVVDMSLKATLKRLPKQPFTYKDAIANGITRHTLRQLLNDGYIERVERGLYQTSVSDFSDQEMFVRAIKKINPPSAIALLSALSYYELTDIIPKKVWIMVPYTKRSVIKNIRLYRSKNPLWDIGITKIDGFTITTLDRTIVDSLTHPTVIPTRVGLDALKTALNRKKTTLSKIIDMSNLLKVKHKILPYIEALS